MNAKFIFVLCAVVSSTVSLGQTYFHFPDSNAVWSVYDKKYYVNGDTVYNSVNYKQYYLSLDSILNPATGSLFIFMREDTLTKQVYAILPGTTQERLIYDFSLNLNDSATVYPMSFWLPDSIRVKVDLVDSVLISGQYRKRMTISGVFMGGPPEYWIEGIGSTFGPFNSGLSGLGIVDIFYPVLICVEQDSVLLYHDPFFIGCYSPDPVGLNENVFDHNILIHPNPFNTSVYVTFQNKNFRKVAFNVLDVLGKSVFKSELDSKYLEDKSEINLSFLPKGIYMMEVVADDKRMVRKMVKE